MSIYGYLSCLDCKETLWVKDEDSDIHCGNSELGSFLEKHKGHHLCYDWEDVMIDGETPSMDWNRFKEDPLLSEPMNATELAKLAAVRYILNRLPVPEENRSMDLI